MTNFRVEFVFGALLTITSGCASVHANQDAPSRSDAGSAVEGDARRTCDPLPDEMLVLEPFADNPTSCRVAASCELWFGHGQHLRCPRYDGPSSPIELECSIRDCLCDDRAGFVADFSTREVLDVRGGEACRYRIVEE